MNIKQVLSLMNTPLNHKGAGINVLVIDQPVHFDRVPFVRPVNYKGSNPDTHGSAVCWLVKQVALGANIYGWDRKAGSLQEALRWAIANDIQVVNMSFTARENPEARQALTAAAQAGITLIAAAGNSGWDQADDDSEVQFPATHPDVITVAALSTAEDVAKYSSGGPEVYISLPGDIELPWPPYTVSGTSFAAPLLAGAAAIFRQVDPTGDFREFVRRNSVDVEAPGRDELSGYGVFRFQPDWMNQKQDKNGEVIKTERYVIDPGHGGSDPGAVGPSGLREKDVVLAVAKNLADILVSAGKQVKLTREDDAFVSLAQRVKISNDIGADVFISIHANAATNRAAKGMEVYTTVGQTSADAIAESISDALEGAFPDLVFRADQSDGDSDKEANFQVLNDTRAPAVLVELAFITNLQEEALLNLASYRMAVAQAIAEGLGVVKRPAPDPTGDAIRALQKAGVIVEPDYWLENARAGKQVDGEYTGMLIQKFAKRLGG